MGGDTGLALCRPSFVVVLLSRSLNRFANYLERLPRGRHGPQAYRKRANRTEATAFRESRRFSRGVSVGFFVALQ